MYLFLRLVQLQRAKLVISTLVISNRQVIHPIHIHNSQHHNLKHLLQVIQRYFVVHRQVSQVQMLIINARL